MDVKCREREGRGEVKGVWGERDEVRSVWGEGGRSIQKGAGDGRLEGMWE